MGNRTLRCIQNPLTTDRSTDPEMHVCVIHSEPPFELEETGELFKVDNKTPRIVWHEQRVWLLRPDIQSDFPESFILCKRTNRTYLLRITKFKSGLVATQYGKLLWIFDVAFSKTNFQYKKIEDLCMTVKDTAILVVTLNQSVSNVSVLDGFVGASKFLVVLFADDMYTILR